MSEIDTSSPSRPREDMPRSHDAGTPAPTGRTCLLVLGMHRSGTSALTRLLSLAGAALPLRLMPAGPGNESGHWEPLHLVEYHDKLLDGLGSAWHDWTAADFSQQTPQQLADIKSNIKRLLAEDYPRGAIYAVKDPRICRFAKLFIETVEETGDEVALVHAFRSPLDVVNSLNSRKVVWPQRYTTTDAALLWLRHVLDAEAACVGRRRALISFDALMSDPKAALARVVQQTGLALEKSWDEIEPDVRTFLSPTQRHHAFDDTSLNLNPDTRGWVERVFLALRDLEANHGDPAALQTIREVAARFDEACPVLGRLRSAVASTVAEDFISSTAEVARLKRQVADGALLKAQLAEVEGHKTALAASLSEAQRAADDLRQRVRDLEDRTAVQAQEIALLQQDIAATHQAYLTSNSWRVTGPLRAVAGSGRSFRRAGRVILRALGGRNREGS